MNWIIFRRLLKKIVITIKKSVGKLEGKKIFSVRTLVKIIKGGLTISAVLGIIFFFSYFYTREIKFLIGAISLLTISLGFFFKGLESIPEEQRWAITVFERHYCIAGPGLIWVCPYLMKIRESVSIWRQRYPLFEKGIKIDFINGSATPKDAFAFVQAIGAEKKLKAKTQQEKDDAEKIIRESVYKMVYNIKDVKGAATALIENTSRSYLNGLTVEEGLTEGKAGYELLKKMEERGKTEEINGLRTVLEEIGLELSKVTITGFDLDETIIKAREEVLKAERAAVAAESKLRQKALESGGMHAEITKILTEKCGYSATEADRLAQEYVLFWKGTEEKAITRWKFEGDGGIYSEIAKIVAIINAAKK